MTVFCPLCYFQRRLFKFVASLFDTYPTCPICGAVYYVKAMPLHLSGHQPGDHDVVAWRAERAGVALTYPTASRAVEREATASARGDR